MKYFEHYSGDRNSVPAKLIRKRFGAEGYGMYMSILEVISEHVKPTNIEDWGHVDPMHEIESLADECSTSSERMAEFLAFCDEKKIFEKHDRRLFCSMILERLDPYANKIRQNPTKSDNVRSKRIEENRTETEENKSEEKRVERENQFTPPSTTPGSQLKSFDALREFAVDAKPAVIAALLFLIFVIPARASTFTTRYTFKPKTTNSRQLRPTPSPVKPKSPSLNREATARGVPIATGGPTKRAENTSYPPSAKPETGSVKERTLSAGAKRFGQSQVASLEALLTREANFQPTVANATSGACGIFQAMPCSKLLNVCPDMNVDCQIDWGMNYIARRYQTPDNAWHFWQNVAPTYDFNGDGAPDNHNWY